MRRWSTLALIVALLLSAYAVRVADLGADSIWHDEAWSIRAFRAPFATPDDNTPHLYYIGGHLLQRIGAGESPFALRYVSVLLGVLTVALTYRVGVAWMGRGAAGLAAGLAAFSPLLWAYSQEVRAYVAVPLIALGVLWLALAIGGYGRERRVPSRLWWLAGAVQIAGLYTHNLSVPLLVWLNIALGMVWLMRRDFAKMRRWAVVEVVVIACYIPWLLTQAPSGTPLNTPPALNPDLIRDVWLSYFLPVPAQLADMRGAVIAWAALGLGAVAAVALLRRRTWRLWLLASHVVLVPLFSTALMLAANIDFHPRYYIAGVPGALLLIGRGAQTLFAARTPSAARQMREAVGYALVLAVGGAVLIVSVAQIRTEATYRHDDFRGLAHYYAALPDDAVIFVPFDVERALQDYYADVVGIRARFVNVPLYSAEADAIEAINALARDDAPRRVEFLTWHQLPADVRGMYPCLLASASAEIGEPRHFFGLTTQTFMLDRTVEFSAVDAPSPRFDGASVRGVASASAPDGACVRADWTFDAPPDDDYSVAFALLNPFGGAVAAVDTAIRRDDNAPTSAWSAGERGTAYAHLRLPDGAPQADYTLTLGVYSAANPSGRDVLDAAGNPAGKVARYAAAVRGEGRTIRDGESAWLDDDAPDGTIVTGAALHVTAFVAPDDARLTLRGADWEQSIETDGGLVWGRFVVPVEATGGDAVLSAGGRELRRYTVLEVARTFTPPSSFDVAVDVAFADGGRLIGADILSETEIVLFWQADGATETAYTVFVQKIGADGRVIAQSDSAPGEGERPTTGWLAGEIIRDRHTLQINVADYSGEAVWIAGLYDPADFRRVLTTTGDDFAMIATAR